VVDLDVTYIPTPRVIVTQMLSLAHVRRSERLYDLGAGDGRILVEAAREFGAKVTGIEIDPDRISRIKERLQSTGVEAQIIQGDFMEVDLSPADVVTMYLSESVNSRLAPKLMRELRDGARIVSLDYELPGFAAEKVATGTSGGLKRKLFLYRVSKPTA
jgi:16S rRNA A1518/A1519 N6-dimethyltransferase RsmA/KsgA/DIM1 with predicted DNA glycosylase/AP lyase activity